MTKTVLVYDFDGTVYRNDSQFRSYFVRSAKKYLANAGVSESEMEKARRSVENGENLSSAHYLKSKGIIESKENFHKAIFSEIPENIIDQERAETMREISHSVDEAGVFTNNSKYAVRKYAEKAGIEDILDFCVGCEQLPSLKPKTESFEKLHEEVGVESNEMILVDNDPKNTTEANKFGINGVLLGEDQNYSGNQITELNELRRLIS